MPHLDPTAVLRNVGRRVAELRQARGWTQEQLAEAASVTVGYVRRIEGGAENLTLESIVRLANLFKVGLDEIITAPAKTKATRGRPPKSPPSDA